MIVFVNGKYVNDNEANINVNDRGYLLADGVYEGFRVYNGKIFKLKEHKQRFQRSLNELKISHTLTDEIETIFEKLFEKNSYKNSDELFYYIQITRGVALRDHAFPKEKTEIGIYAFVSKKDLNEKAYNEGLKVCTAPDNRWARCDIKCISLTANCLAKQNAIDEGFDDALFVHDGVITEATASNVFFVKDNIIYTHAATNRILSGITRNFVIDLCNENGFKLKEFPLTIDKLKSIDEAFLTGTTLEVTPIVKINDISINNQKIGEITKKLQSLFKNYLQENFYKKS